MPDFNAKARAEHCVADLDGELNTRTNDDDEDCVNVTVFDTIERYIQNAYTAGSASRNEDAAYFAKQLEAVQMALCDSHVEGGGYDATRLAPAVRHLRAQLAEKEAECERLRARLKGGCRKYSGGFCTCSLCWEERATEMKGEGDG